MGLAVDELLGLLAHELRSPIATLRSACQLAAARGHDDSGAAFEVVDRQSRQLERILDDLQCYSRAERCVLQVDPTRCHAGDVVERVVSWIEPLRRERGHVVDVSSSGPVELMADSRALEHMLRNVLWNAIQFDPDGGAVQIRLRGADDTLSIAVCDAGYGVPDEEEDSLFVPFVRHRPRGTGAPGPGLGLTVARHLARAHGGDLTLRSGPEVGAIAEIVLPRAR